MGVEIERKFLVRGETWRAGIARSEAMEQGYLAQSDSAGFGFPGCSVRVRRAGESAHLNIKSREAGAKRLEFEFAIEPAMGSALLLAFCRQRIVKSRHHTTHAGAHWEIDVFEGDNAGLVVAEIELGAIDQQVLRPEWAGIELTHEPRFYNSALVSAPFATWPDRNYWLELSKAC